MDLSRIRRGAAYWRLSLAALLIALLLATGVNTPVSAQPATPDVPFRPGSPEWVTPPYEPWLLYGSGNAGAIYIGAFPPGSENKPVLVFVPGKGQRAESWWRDTVLSGHNDMYEYAYNYGYRTAFVNLWDANGGWWGGSMWQNGEMLSSQINTIRNWFGVPGVNIVAHSKGGVDTQAALVHYGAAPQVQKIMRSSPTWPTPIRCGGSAR
jgi:hypothetical protein